MATGAALVEWMELSFRVATTGTLIGSTYRCQSICQQVHCNAFVIDDVAQDLGVDHVVRPRGLHLLAIVWVKVAPVAAYIRVWGQAPNTDGRGRSYLGVDLGHVPEISIGFERGPERSDHDAERGGERRQADADGRALCM